MTNDRDYSKPTFIFAFIVVLFVALVGWAAMTQWATIPLLEAITDEDIPFWPTYIVTLVIVGMVTGGVDRRMGDDE